MVHGNNIAPTVFPGSESGTTVNLAAGSYAVIEIKPEPASFNYNAEWHSSSALLSISNFVR